VVAWGFSSKERVRLPVFAIASGLVLQLALLLATAQRVEHETGGGVYLSSLNPKCVLVTATVAARPWPGLWIACGGERIMVPHSSGLVGNVRIRTEAQALEFLRLFSGKARYRLFRLVDYVEIEPGAESRAFTLEKRLFEQICEPPATEAMPSYGGVSLFRVRRCLLDVTDLGIYDVEEVVDEYGNVQRTGRTLLRERADRLGIMPVTVM
jgi:hypothetical protein